jgi:type IV secretory pathway VirB10-like protein
MKILGTLCTLALFLFLIAPAPGYSQDRDENKPNQQDEQKPKDNDKGKREDKAARPDDSRRNGNPNMGRQDDRNQPEANRPQERQQREQQPRDQDRNQREQRPAEQQRPMDNDHRTAQGNDRDRNQHAGNRGRRIPDDQFRTHFGREHHFHVQREQVVNVSQPVVVYGGYSWQLAEPWPSDWSYDDDCYIDDVDGEYFMFDALHPGIRIAVFIAE